MSSHNHHHDHPKTLNRDVLNHTGVSANKCYQCGKCTAGCPLAEDMDYPPGRVMRLLQTEDPKKEELLLAANSIWLCLSCSMCFERCPMEIDIPVVMDYLRTQSLKQNKVNKESKNIVQFHEAFLESIRSTGRLYEMGLVVDYKLRSKKWLQDVGLAPNMYAKGKLHILPDVIKGKKEIEKIFKKTLDK